MPRIFPVTPSRVARRRLSVQENQESVFHNLSTFVENEETTISFFFYVLNILLSVSSWNYVNRGSFLA